MSKARRAVRIVVQLLGFAVGLALLWWVVSGVLAPRNREQLLRLGEAPAWKVAALLALGMATTIINGAVFHAAIWPVKRLRTLDIQSVNAAASLLALLPFKLGMIFRIVFHNRRDGLPLLTIAAWFAAVAATMLVVALPAVGASLWQIDGVRGGGGLDARWWLTAGGGTVVLTAAMIAVAKAMSQAARWAWVERTVRRMPLPSSIKGSGHGGRAGGTRPGLLPRAHEGLRMLAHGRAVVACVALRMLDAGVQAARFVLAASILGVDLPTSKAVIAGTAYFLIGAVAPTGQIGAREAGTAGLLGAIMGGVDMEQFQLVVLLVSASEAGMLLLAGGAGVVWLKLWRGIGKQQIGIDRERNGAGTAAVSENGG